MVDPETFLAPLVKVVVEKSTMAVFSVVVEGITTCVTENCDV